MKNNSKIAKAPVAKAPEIEKEIEADMEVEDEENIADYSKSGKIATEVVKYARSIVKKGVPLLEIADKIEEKIIQLGGKPAFPTNLSINDIAAHYTPNHDDKTLASGLIKVDLGVHVNGHVVDTAFSVDLENSSENKKLIEASEKALAGAIKTIKENVEINKIGLAVQNEITALGYSPIRNLSGHEIRKYNLHAGITIPNCDNGNKNELPEGVYAIEPFATNGLGQVYDGGESGIYRYVERKGIRDMTARKILDYIEEEFLILPFCERWIYKKFGIRTAMSLRLLEQAGAISQFSQLIEKNHGIVSQAENTVMILDGKVEVLVK